MPTSGTGPFWSVIVPSERTNVIVNPSFEYGTANWTALGAASNGSVSGTGVAGVWSLRVNGQGAGSLGNGRGVVYGTANGLSGNYVLSAYVYTTSGSVGLQAGTDNTVEGGWYGTAAGSQSGWFRLTTPTFVPTGGSVFPKIIAFGTAMTGTIYVDAVQLERGTNATTYIDGDQVGCSWNGAEHSSASSRGRNTRVGGEVVRLEDIGFTVDTAPGIGAPPFTTISQSYAQLDGGEFQRQRKAERRFTLTSLVDGTSWADLHYQRRRFIEAVRIENMPTQQPLRLLYSGAGGTMAIDAVWDGGMQFDADGQSFAEGVVASFTAYDPDWKDTLQQGTTLAPNEVLNNIGGIMARSPMGKWQELIPNGRTLYNYSGRIALAESPDAGTLYVGIGTMTNMGILNDIIGLAYITYDGLTWGQVGTTNVDYVSGVINRLEWDYDYSRLFILGQSLNITGTNTGQLGWWTPSTNRYGSAGWIGTGTRFAVGMANPTAEAYSIINYAPGTYYIGGGPFHRVNGVLFGSNWNLVRWNGAVGGHSAAEPVSVNGTGFVRNAEFIGVGFGSSPGVVQKLTRFDKDRILVSAVANTLRGYGTSYNAALYDVRGTWGTIPGYRIPTNTYSLFQDTYRAEDRSIYYGYTGTSTIGTTMFKIQGLTASPLGTISSDYIQSMAADSDTSAWISGPNIRINSTNSVYELVRTNGYDFQPGDLIDALNSPEDILVSRNGTTYFAYTVFSSNRGTAASLGTILNTGMSNVYPTLRLRNQSAGTATIYQWANMTTREYAWFSLAMLPGEVATLTTGPGRVAFRSSYRGDILSTIVGGSKLASWKLLPGQNIVSFLASNTDVVADMYWTPRHHSADGTGIV